MMTPNVPSDEPDVAHYKTILRQSMRQQDDAMNRSQEFLGGSDTFSPRTSIKKSPRPSGNSSNDRPDDWLGSPASKRKSYTVKGSTTAKSPGIAGRHSLAVSSLKDSSIPAVDLSPSKSPTGGRPPSGISRHSVKGQTANTKTDNELQASQSPKSTVPSGITRHTLGGSSSHHDSTSKMGESSPDPEYYKTVLRASMQDGPTRSQDFLGGSDHSLPNTSPLGAFKKPSPKPVVPISPDRPTEWLGSPSSHSRKSYTIKGAAVASIPNLDSDDTDDDDFHGDDVQLPPAIMAIATSRQARPIKAQSIAIGATAPVRASPTKKSGPRAKSQSLSIGQRAPWDASPLGQHERVDHGKFVAAFSIFENSKTDPPAGSSNSKLSPKLSPCTGAKRNFTISDEAKRRSLALSLDPFSDHGKPNPNEELQSVVARLRKVTLAPGGSPGRPKEATWLERIRQLRMTGGKEYSDMLQNLQDRGLVSCNLGPQRMDQVRQATVRLEQVRKQNPKAKEELSTVLDMHLRKLTPTSSGSFESIQQAIAKLRKVVIDDRTGVEEVIGTLDSVLESMQEGQEAQLAQALSGMNEKEENIQEADDEPEVQPVKEPEKATIQTKKEPATPIPEKKDNKQDKIRFAKSRITPKDADFLVQALLKLKKVQLTKQEAGKIAGFIRNLNPVGKTERTDTAVTSDEALSNLSKQLESNKHKDEILNVLNGLRKISLNDPERAELAEVVRGLGKGFKYRNEIGDAISKLRKVQFTPPEAKEAAGIMFNLRKVKKRVTFNLDQSREMVNLRKVMTPEKADAVADAFTELSKADLSEKEMDELAGAVVDLGVEPLGQDDCMLLSVEYHDGKPEMVLNIPEGEDYLEHLKESDVADCIKAEPTGTNGDIRFSVNVDRTVDRDESDHVSLGEESAFEQASLTEEESPRRPKMVVKIRKSMPSPKPSPIVSPKRASAKKLHHYGDGQNDVTSPVDEADEKKIRFSHKPHWRHKKHNNTVVNEKRWRFEEDFNADEVIWSPLSREQYDRRKTVGASILKTMMEFAPLDDMVLDEYEEDGEGTTKK